MAEWMFLRPPPRWSLRDFLDRLICEYRDTVLRPWSIAFPHVSRTGVVLSNALRDRMGILPSLQIVHLPYVIYIQHF